jgi:hypothetical protein
VDGKEMKPRHVLNCLQDDTARTAILRAIVHKFRVKFANAVVEDLERRGIVDAAERFRVLLRHSSIEMSICYLRRYREGIIREEYAVIGSVVDRLIVNSASEHT